MIADRLEATIFVGTVVHNSREAARRAAFEAFITQSRLERAYRLAGSILRNRSEAEDSVHDAVMQAWLHWGELRDIDRLAAWFDRILVNDCRRRLRSRRIRPLDPAPEAWISGNVFESVHQRDMLYYALKTLDADHRIAVVLRYIADLTPPEIAARTGAREGTVKSRLHYALRELRSALEAAERKEGFQ